METKTKNIGGVDKDKFHRYKRPVPIIKVEKPGTNGVKTVVENMTAIAKALEIPPEYPTRFFGYELGAQATYEDSADRTCTIIKGKHTVQDLDRLLEEFIKKFILCPKCKLPETKISVKKEQLRIDCRGCGFAGPLVTGHRLENFIAKNPPNQKKDGFKSLKKTEDPAIGSEREPESKAEDEKEEWSLDTSEEAQKARRAEFLAAQLTKTHLSKDDKENTKPEDILKNFMKNTTDVVSIIAELDRLQLKLGVSPEERYRILLVSAIDVSAPKTIATQFTTHAPLFKRLVKDKASGVLLITSIERLLDSASPRPSDTGQESRSKLKEDLKANFVTRIGVILQKLYDMDVLSEEMILTWAQSPPEASMWAVGKDVAVYARSCAKPLIEWLQGAEEE